MAKKQITRWALPTSKAEPLPPIGAFGTDDFYRARYFSSVIESYAPTPTAAAVLVAFARMKRMPSMSFADTLEAMARFIHQGGDDAFEVMISNTTLSREEHEIATMFREIVQESIAHHGDDSRKIFVAMIECLRVAYPKASLERIKGALQCGNTEQGFSTGKVLEAMRLTEQP
mgnify:CR=1 FL=1